MVFPARRGYLLRFVGCHSPAHHYCKLLRFPTLVATLRCCEIHLGNTTNMLVVLRSASLTVNRQQVKCGFVLKRQNDTIHVTRAIKKDASTARVFFDGVPYRFAFAQSPDSFHLPPTISTITRAR